MENNLNGKWEPVKNFDPARRKPNEWAKIYHIELIGNIPNEIWSEYEWAYNLFKLKYRPLPDRKKDGTLLDSYEKSSEMEMRAMELKRDLYMGADLGEKYVLDQKYIETEWVRRRMNTI